jgi:hypothetical protein
MWVHAFWRRRGLARHLLAELIAWAQGHPEIEKLGLYVFSTNTAAIRLYQEHGFVVEGRYPRDMKFGDGSYVDTVAMELLVKARPRKGRPEVRCSFRSSNEHPAIARWHDFYELRPGNSSCGRMLGEGRLEESGSDG